MDAGTHPQDKAVNNNRSLYLPCCNEKVVLIIPEINV